MDWAELEADVTSLSHRVYPDSKFQVRGTRDFEPVSAATGIPLDRILASVHRQCEVDPTKHNLLLNVPPRVIVKMAAPGAGSASRTRHKLDLVVAVDTGDPRPVEEQEVQGDHPGYRECLVEDLGQLVDRLVTIRECMAGLHHLVLSVVRHSQAEPFKVDHPTEVHPSQWADLLPLINRSVVHLLAILVSTVDHRVLHLDRNHDNRLWATAGEDSQLLLLLSSLKVHRNITLRTPLRLLHNLHRRSPNYR